MASSRLLTYFLVFYVIVSVQINGCHSNSNRIVCLPEKLSPLFIFGDSLFDSGNNNYFNATTILQANYEPYGQTFFKFPTGRFSDGRVIPDFIAKYADLPLLPPYLYPGIYIDHYIYGVNFASAGAGALVETRQETVINLKSQASNFRKVSNLLRQKLGEAEAKALISRAVFLFSVGGNDYATPFLVSNSTVVLPYPTPQEFVDIVIGNITTVIKEVYEEGGRKFGFVNVGPFNCFPVLRRNGSSISSCLREEASALAALHNSVFPKTLQKLQKQLKGFTYSIFDFYTALVQVMKYPSKYGFKVGDVACCGGGAYRGDYSCGGKRGIEEYELCENVTEFVFFDSIHPTDKADQHFATLMWSGNKDIVQPYNMRQLFESGFIYAGLQD